MTAAPATTSNFYVVPFAHGYDTIMNDQGAERVARAASSSYLASRTSSPNPPRS